MFIHARFLKLRLALLACGISLCSALHAADLYRWVDANGRTHFSDQVPWKYQKSATRIDSRQYELSLEQRREAAARSAQGKMHTETDEAATAGSPMVAPPSGPRPATDGSSDCARLYRLYRESLECFAPYVTAHGGVKAEAFKKCTPVLDPSRQCGPAKPD